MEETLKRRITVRGIIYKDGKLFCQRLKNADGSGRSFWCTPGGGLESGEALIDGLKREMMEETGVPAVVGKLLFVQQYSERQQSGDHDAYEFLEFFFHIENAEDYDMIDEHASHFDAEIFSCDFVDPATSNVLPQFLQTIDLNRYIAENLPVFLYTEFNQP